ncbi:MAG: hypothetical protein H0W08_26405 [Acidobacteria bacterium]|nr:hypothetical protein [Acidobacteriota bacterium]
MRNLIRDVSLAARLLRRSRSFTIAAVLTLALGIGANTAMFTLADATLLRPVRVREPERLVVWSWTSSYPDYQDYLKSMLLAVRRAILALAIRTFEGQPE